jgi:ribosome maturation factor RimP
MTSTDLQPNSIGLGRRIEDLLGPTAASFGYEIVALAWKSGKSQLLQVFLDGPDGVTIDACAKMSRMFSQVLDAAETSGEQPELARALARAYSLEVSSPGLERPLQKLQHFQSFIGRTASVQTRVSLDPVSGRKKIKGVIDGVDASAAAPQDPYAGAVHLIDCDTQEKFRIPLGEIRRANLVYEG